MSTMASNWGHLPRFLTCSTGSLAEQWLEEQTSSGSVQPALESSLRRLWSNPLPDHNKYVTVVNKPPVALFLFDDGQYRISYGLSRLPPREDAPEGVLMITLENIAAL